LEKSCVQLEVCRVFSCLSNNLQRTSVTN
jgi:hypothetical protein